MTLNRRESQFLVSEDKTKEAKSKSAYAKKTISVLSGWGTMRKTFAAATLPFANILDGLKQKEFRAGGIAIPISRPVAKEEHDAGDPLLSPEKMDALLQACDTRRTVFLFMTGVSAGVVVWNLLDFDFSFEKSLIVIYALVITLLFWLFAQREQRLKDRALLLKRKTIW